MVGKNLAVTIPEPGRVELVERPFPSIVAGYCVIKTEIAPICLEGTRIWTEHDFEFHDDPEHLGHEGVGTVVEVVPGSNLSVGDRVIVFQGDYCGRCHSCHQGLSPTYCDANDPDIQGPDRAAMRGIELRNGSESGGFAMERYRIAPEANVYRIPDGVDFRHAAACNCSYGVGYSNQEVMGVKAGDSVVVGGVGFIAMGHVIAALYRNANVIALARNAYRIALLKQLGVQHIINPDDPDWCKQVRALTYRGEGADFAVDGSGVAYYQERLLQCLRKYGQINFSGHTPGAVLNLSPLHHVLDPATTLFGQHDVRAIDRAGLVRSLCDQRVKSMIDTMVTHEFPVSRASEAFALQASKQCGKIYLRFTD